MTARGNLVRLAHKRPELRGEVLPLLHSAATYLDAKVPVSAEYRSRLETEALPATEIAGHRHVLEALKGVEKALENLRRALPSRALMGELEAVTEVFRKGFLINLGYPLVLLKRKEETELELPDF